MFFVQSSMCVLMLVTHGAKMEKLPISCVNKLKYLLFGYRTIFEKVCSIVLSVFLLVHLLANNKYTRMPVLKHKGISRFLTPHIPFVVI